MLPRGEPKDQATGQVAVMMARSGDLPAARDLVSSIVVDGTRASVLHQIVLAQAESGDVSGALQAAAAIADESNRSEAIQAVAGVQANARDFQGAFRAAIDERVDSLITSSGNVFSGSLEQIVAFATAQRLPAMYYRTEYVDAGGLMARSASDHLPLVVDFNLP